MPGWRWRWFLPWVALAVLSTFDAKSIPFFAVLGGPVLAWNLVEFGRRKYAAEAKVERAVAQAEVPGQARTAQIDVAELQPQAFVDIDVLGDREGQREARVEHRHF